MNTFAEDGTAVPENRMNQFCFQYACARGHKMDDYLRVFDAGAKSFSLRLIADADDLLAQIARLASEADSDKWLSLVVSSARCAELLNDIFGLPHATDNRSDAWKNTRNQSPAQLREAFLKAGATPGETLDRLVEVVATSKHIQYEGASYHLLHLCKRVARTHTGAPDK